MFYLKYRSNDFITHSIRNKIPLTTRHFVSFISNKTRLSVECESRGTLSNNNREKEFFQRLTILINSTKG